MKRGSGVLPISPVRAANVNRRAVLLPIFCVVIGSIIVLLLVGNILHKQTTLPKPPTASVANEQAVLFTHPLILGKNQLLVAVAYTLAQQELGLGNQHSLQQNQGMLFVYQQPQMVTYWMYRMYLPLDFIWIANHQVIGITQNVPPPAHPDSTALPLYSPPSSVDAVLEVPAGYVAKHQLGVGTSVTW